ncbi:MAG: hypothetical protein V4726_22760 [Verrucomicrobiota bacterium]
MKTLFPSLLAIAAGFGVSRLISRDFVVAAGSPVSAVPSAANSSVVTTIPFGPGKATAASGGHDWKTAAKAWAEADPAGFYQWMIKRGIPPDREAMITLFTTWVKQDPDAAFEAAFNFPADFQASFEILDLLLETSLNQPRGLEMALKWSPAVEEQVRGYSGPKGPWLTSAAPERIGELLAKGATGKMFSGGMLRTFAEFWASRDQAAALAWMRSLPPALKSGAARGIIENWTAGDPAAALHYLATDAGTSERFYGFVPLAELAKTDPAAAVGWWEKHKGISDFNSLNQIYQKWCASGSREAMDYSMAVEDPTLRRNCLAAWSTHAPKDQVMTLIPQMPEGQDRSTLIENLSKYSGQAESQDFLRRLVSAGGSDITPQLAGMVSRNLTYSDPGTTLNWVGTLPENLQSSALPNVFNAWRDQFAASRAVDQLPDGAFKTAAQKALRDKLSGRKP